MAKILELPLDQSDEILHRFLKDNKKALIAQKMLTEKRFDAVSYRPSTLVEEDGEVISKKIGDAKIPEDATTLLATFAGNTSMWCDTSYDVLLKNAGAKSIKERKGIIPHLRDHVFMQDYEIGEIKNIYYADVPLRELWPALKKDGTAQALMFESLVQRSLSERSFEKYRDGKAKQHSIALRYVEIDLAINRPNDDYYEDEYKNWIKYIDQIINKEWVMERGFFYIVKQFILIEVSLVLAGANILTNTIAVEPATKGETTEEEPPGDKGTQTQPVIEQPVEVDMKAALAGIRLFN